MDGLLARPASSIARLRCSTDERLERVTLLHFLLTPLAFSALLLPLTLLSFSLDSWEISQSAYFYFARTTFRRHLFLAQLHRTTSKQPKLKVLSKDGRAA